MDDQDEVFVETDGEESLGDSEENIAATEERAEHKIGKLRKEIETLRKEKQESLDGWQRSKADYVNALRRFEEEKRDAIDLGKMKAAEAFMPAMDSLERAKDGGELPEGFSGIVKQLENAAKSIGLVQFGEVGEHFDPNQHEALGQDVTEDKDQDDVVTAVLATGWKLGDRILRAAKVRVAQFEG
jgi:molecular chaperone GrpE